MIKVRRSANLVSMQQAFTMRSSGRVCRLCLLAATLLSPCEGCKDGAAHQHAVHEEVPQQAT